MPFYRPSSNSNLLGNYEPLRVRTLAISSSTGTGSINSLNYAFLSSSLKNSFSYIVRPLEPNNTYFNVSFITYSVNPCNDSDTFWSLDNCVNFKVNHNILSASNPTSSADVQLTSSIKGELVPYEEYEIRNIISPIGSYSATYYIYDKNSFRALLRPQYLFLNHYYSFMENAASDSSRLGSTEVYTRNFFYNKGMYYHTDYLSGKKPFYKSYEDFSSDIKSIGQNYSIVPEYYLSDDIEYYYIEKNGDFTEPKNIDYLSLDGITDFDGNTDNTLNDFKTQKYYTTDVLNTNIHDENADSLTKKASKLNLKIKGIKKLLPYKGFYPQDRSVQVVDLFRNSFINLTTNQLMLGQNKTVLSPIDQQLAALIQPLFAPGILFNTIKASIAVDWPTFLTKSTTDTSYFYGTGSDQPLSASNLHYIIDKEYNYRLPFESILDIRNAIPASYKKDYYESNTFYYNTIAYLNPTYYGYDMFSGSDRTNITYPVYPIVDRNSSINKTWEEKNSLYRLGINNFLSEIVDFFLEGASLTTFNSKTQSEITKNAANGYYKADKTYFMDVVLSRGKNQKQILDKQFNINIITAETGTIGSPPVTYTNYDYLTVSKTFPESNFYGPPTRFWVTSQIPFSSASYVNANRFVFSYNSYVFSTLYGSSSYPVDKLADPAFAPHTPPYYYGKSIARISYKPTSGEEFTIKNAIASSKIEYLNEEAKQYFDTIVDGDFTTTPAYRCMMALSASLNLKQIKNDGQVTFDVDRNSISTPNQVTNTRDPNGDIWSIQTKFETPLLNFSNSLNNNVNTIFYDQDSSRAGLNPGPPPSYDFQAFQRITALSSVGLWSGYGSIPSGSDEGISLSLEESFGDIDNDTTGSLKKLLGFSTVTKDQIGKIAKKKIVSEAIVIIPYTTTINESGLGIYARTAKSIQYENANERYFYVDKDVLNNSIQNNENTLLKRTYETLKNYVLPPHIDWVQNNTIDPFVMFIAEFKTDLDQQDLSDIWQGLLPQIGTIAEKDQIDISLDINDPKDFFHGRALPSDIKFKVFKIKKKAKINYYKLTSDSGDDDKFKFDFGTKTFSDIQYSYNWPYDYFSLVDRVQIEAGFTVENKEDT